MSVSVIEGLLREQQTAVVSERRNAGRQPFVRPVQVVLNCGRTKIEAFSRDVSKHGISLILPKPVQAGLMADLAIHRLFGSPTTVRAEARWCSPYGNGWYASGWHFLTE